VRVSQKRSSIRRLVIALVLASAAGTLLIAQQGTYLRTGPGGTIVPMSTTTEAQHDTALGTVTNVKGYVMFCRSRASAPTDVSADEDAAMVYCNRKGILEVEVVGAIQNFPGATTNGGASPGFYISTASNNSTNIKASSGTLYSFSVINVTASLKYIRIYDLGAAPTCTSATGIIYYSPIPGSTTNPVPLTWTAPVGKRFDNGIGFCITGGAGTTDNTSTAAGDAVFNYDYK